MRKSIVLNLLFAINFASIFPSLPEGQKRTYVRCSCFNLFDNKEGSFALNFPIADTSLANQLYYGENFPGRALKDENDPHTLTRKLFVRDAQGKAHFVDPLAQETIRELCARVGCNHLDIATISITPGP